ncbi:hypothetical protein CALVIDRAFT_601810 [Calocera viscosa TUFC12733]|uniref:F-box domain-containing protein n=1 Tax=Calocera viscosa (strain TUFC12733) TaxID=1330018 RepID=A0A167HTU4_CALVF|nr:hypothetical protein CALVIDRAFT_601810 [Calocera viscosa TUFC12733]
MYRSKWCLPAVLRLVATNLQGMPNLTGLDYIAVAALIRCSPLRSLACRLQNLSVFAFLDDDVLHALNEQSTIRRLSILDMGPESNEVALIPAMDRIISPTTLPALEELIAPLELAYRLLPGRPIRHLSVPSVMEDIAASRLAQAIAATRGPIVSLHLHTFSFETFERTLPAILQATTQLLVLNLDFIEIRNQPTLERLNSSPGLSFFTPLSRLRKLLLRFTLRATLLQEDHHDFLQSFQHACPALEEVVLSSMLRGESVTYARTAVGAGGKWDKVRVMAQNQASFYAAHA